MFNVTKNHQYSAPITTIAFTVSDVERICYEIAPTGEKPIVIFGRESEELVMAKLAEDCQASEKAISPKLIQRFQQSFNIDWDQNDRSRAPFSVQLQALGQRLIFLPGFDSTQGVVETLTTYGRQCYIIQQENFGFTDPAPDRILSSCLQIIRHEARHLIREPLNDTQKEMMCDAVSLLHGLRDAVQNSDPLVEKTFRLQCEEHAKYHRMGAAFDSRYQLNQYVAISVRDYSRESALLLRAADIEQTADSICRDIWYRFVSSSWNETAV